MERSNQARNSWNFACFRAKRSRETSNPKKVQTHADLGSKRTALLERRQTKRNAATAATSSSYREISRVFLLLLSPLGRSSEKKETRTCEFYSLGGVVWWGEVRWSNGRDQLLDVTTMTSSGELSSVRNTPVKLPTARYATRAHGSVRCSGQGVSASRYGRWCGRVDEATTLTRLEGWAGLGSGNCWVETLSRTQLLYTYLMKRNVSRVQWGLFSFNFLYFTVFI